MPSDLISAEQFKTALSTFATGVTIVTTRSPQGEPIGITANSFNSVSMSPPLVLWSLSRQAGSFSSFCACSHYAIHILSAEQRDLALLFAARNVDRFAGLQYDTGLGGVPLLPGVLATFECSHRSQHVEGDHIILVGEVLSCQVRGSSSPLIYHGGRFFTELPIQP